jgi:flagellar motor switch protein FliN/FliY
MNAPSTGSRFLDLELPVEVWLASEEVALEKLLDLEPGGVLPLSRDPDGPVDLVVNGVVVASGELVLVDGKFGLRVVSTALQKLAALDPLQGAKGNS